MYYKSEIVRILIEMTHNNLRSIATEMLRLKPPMGSYKDC